MLIEYDNGYMNLNLDAFFPTNSARIRKLVKLFFRIGWEDTSEYIDKCIEHIEKRIPKHKLDTKEIVNAFVSLRTEKAEVEECIRSKKKANGVRLTKSEMKEYRARKKELAELLKDLSKDSKQMVKDWKKLKENLELLKKLR